jgi:hypothetical protein
MTWINTITNTANQGMTLKLPNGDKISFDLIYMPQNQGWYYSFTYGNFSISNKRIVTGVNMLRAFRNILPFGFACVTKDGYEPIYIDDFTSGRANFYLLDSTDIVLVETMLAT